MKYCIASYLYLLITLSLVGCLEAPTTYPAVPPGPWRATLELGTGSTDEAFEERTEGYLPFNFDVAYRGDSVVMTVQNGEERIVLDQITYGRDRTIGKDTIRIDFPAFGTYILALYEEDAIEGDFFDPSRGEDYSVPFRAYHGITERFTGVDSADMDVTGRWLTRFRVERDDPFSALGVFEQDDDDRVTGTFITETGDYRYLDGRAMKDRLFLSTFDGSHAYLFEAKYLPDGTLSGIYRSGVHYKTYWSAERDTGMILANPAEMTYLKEGYETVEISFPDTDGNLISLDSEQFKGRPKVIQIMGTWCPNCKDESAFLVEYIEKNPDIDVAFLGLAFERYESEEKARKAIQRYREAMDISYPILHAGSSSKADASQALPMLNGVQSFPTLLFLDRENRVTAIHTGFNGPATDRYDAFVRYFEGEIDRLLSEG